MSLPPQACAQLSPATEATPGGGRPATHPTPTALAAIAGRRRQSELLKSEINSFPLERGREAEGGRGVEKGVWGE